MNKNILNTISQEFINSNLNSDLVKLRLKKIQMDGVSLQELIHQIEAKQRCKQKLPSWYNSEAIYYPDKLNIEQTSSEVTAAYKSKIMNGKTVLDLSAGLGVDSFYFSKVFQDVTSCEIDSDLSEIAAHNFKQLGANNIHTVASDGIVYLQEHPRVYDLIYADPSRRHDLKGKVFYLKDCVPNIPQHLELLLDRTEVLLIKTSPMLDISVGLSELPGTEAIHIVAVNNEVKELLFLVKRNYNGPVTINTANIKKDESEYFSFQRHTEMEAEPSYGDVGSYLYEPNAAILKAGAFNLMSSKLGVDKLHKHSHLYTSSKVITFPGRRFRVDQVVPYKPKLLKPHLQSKKANVSTRNFPQTVAQIKKRFQLSDGGERYVFFTTDNSNTKIAILSSKL